MKTITINKRARSITALLEQALDEDVVLETEDGLRFVLSAVDDFAEEIEKQRRNPELMAYLDECAKDKDGGIPLEQLKRELGLDRKKTTKSRKRTKAGQKQG
jgi:hypothetical protein